MEPATIHENKTTGMFWAASTSHAPSSSYALNGKIMLFFSILLFLAFTSILWCHGSARLFFDRRHRRRNRRRVQAHIRSLAAVSSPSSSRPLPRSVLVKIPTFVYSSKNAHSATSFDCAVCLSEFEDGEEGRVLPMCNHVFHVECIDTWFNSRSSCPLCRAPVQPPKPDSTCSSCNIVKASDPSLASSSSSSFPTRFPPENSQRQPMEFLAILVDVPRGTGETGVGLAGENGSMSSIQRGPSLKRVYSI